MPSSPITEHDVEGLKHFAKIRSLLGSLHSNGCDRDKANNRSLHMDEYLSLIHISEPTRPY